MKMNGILVYVVKTIEALKLNDYSFFEMKEKNKKKLTSKKQSSIVSELSFLL